MPPVGADALRTLVLVEIGARHLAGHSQHHGIAVQQARGLSQRRVGGFREVAGVPHPVAVLRIVRYGFAFGHIAQVLGHPRTAVLERDDLVLHAAPLDGRGLHFAVAVRQQVISVDPARDRAAEFHLNVSRLHVAVHAAVLTRLEVGRAERLRTHLTIGRGDRNLELHTVLRHQQRVVNFLGSGRIGGHVGCLGTRLGRKITRGRIEHPGADSTLDDDVPDVETRFVGHADDDPRHFVLEGHLRGRQRGLDPRLHGHDQVGSRVVRTALIRLYRKLRRRRGTGLVGIIGEERRGGVDIFVPEETLGLEIRTVERHLLVRHERRTVRRHRDREADLVVQLEIGVRRPRAGRHACRRQRRVGDRRGDAHLLVARSGAFFLRAGGKSHRRDCHQCQNLFHNLSF